MVNPPDCRVGWTIACPCPRSKRFSFGSKSIRSFRETCKSPISFEIGLLIRPPQRLSFPDSCHAMSLQSGSDPQISSRLTIKENPCLRDHLSYSERQRVPYHY